MIIQYIPICVPSSSHKVSQRNNEMLAKHWQTAYFSFLFIKRVGIMKYKTNLS